MKKTSRKQPTMSQMDENVMTAEMESDSVFQNMQEEVPQQEERRQPTEREIAMYKAQRSAFLKDQIKFLELEARYSKLKRDVAVYDFEEAMAHMRMAEMMNPNPQFNPQNIPEDEGVLGSREESEA